MHRTFALSCLICLTRIAAAEWKVVGLSDEPSSPPSLVHRHVDLKQPETGDRAVLDLALFSKKSGTLRIIDNPDGASDVSTLIGRTSGLLAAVNGGYFDEHFTPLGLRLIDGRITSRLTGGRLLTGVMASNGSLQIFRVREFPTGQKWNAAVECGPLLVDLARPVRGLESSRVARRTFAATGSKDRAVLGFCPEATLSELGNMLATSLGDLKIERALNLDGGSSSAFWFKRKDGSVLYYPEEKPVRDFVGITPR
jgi:Phosphodiester glycosidase